APHCYHSAAVRFWGCDNKSDCPKLKNRNRRNKNRTNEARGRAYALGEGEANPNSNVVTWSGSRFDTAYLRDWIWRIGVSWSRDHELLVYVRDTCASSSKQSEKLIEVTPINKNRKVRFAEPSTSLRVISSTSASGSKPPGNTKKNRISQPTSSNKRNKVEDHLRSVNSSLNKKNRVSELVCNASVTHYVLNVNSELICATCNELPPKKPISTIVVKKTLPSSNNSGKLKDITNVACLNFPLVHGLGLLQAHDRAALLAHQLCDDLLKGLRGSNLYTMSLKEMMQSSPICLLSKAFKTKSWLWHKRLSRLYFGYINELAKHGLVRGLPKLKYQKDHLCPACSLGKSKKHTHKPKTDDSIQEMLYLLHMDLCGPMRIKSFNGKKYILVIVDDDSWFTWTLQAYYDDVGISHQTSVARTPQQNGVVERRNRTVVEDSRTMLIFSRAPLFLLAKAVATACYTQNRSLIRRHHNKTPYELIHDRKPDLIYFHVFGALCYPTNDDEDSGPELQLVTPGTISSGLVQNPSYSTPYVPPTKNDWDILFQPIFDEFVNPPPSVASPVPAAAASRPADPTGSPSSTFIDQDAPSTSTSSTIHETQSPVISEGVEEQLQPA
ncbi:retrovirus-related pol polyprotein from transposon TNT 1-94, partial [Tanacetum coccineum]